MIHHILGIIEDEDTVRIGDAPGEASAAAAMVRRDSRQAVALLLPGDVAHPTVDTAEKLDANLIILDHKGVSKIGAFALGSVAERVAEMSRRKGLIVK